MDATDFQKALDDEYKLGIPSWPCPHCGHQMWNVHSPYRQSAKDIATMYPATCGHCGVLETAHHVDGEWMGAHDYAMRHGWGDRSLYKFVMFEAEKMKEEQ